MHALRLHRGPLAFVACSTLLTGAALLTPACSDDGSQPPIQLPPPKVTSLEPAGCAFKVETRPEYIDFAVGKTEVRATPNIRRVRLGLGGNVAVGAEGRADPATSAGFAWQTDDGTLASEVQWGTTPDPTTWPGENRTNGATWLTPAGLINGNGDIRMHEAYVCGLKPATTYYYRVGGGPEGKEVWSDVYSFTTTPNDPGATVKIGVAGDARTQLNDAWRLIQKRMQLEGVALQLFSGDVANLAPDQLEWDKWIDLASTDSDGSPLTLAQILLLSAHGNHENHTTLFYSNAVLPQDIGNYPLYPELFFSVDVGPAHIIVLDDSGVGSFDTDYIATLSDWLRADLKAATANRANVPWIITVHHQSEFSSSNHGNDSDVLRGRSFFMPIWDEFHVDLNLAGHDHDYERTKPLKGPAENPAVQTSFADGTVYVVCAGAGAPAYSAGVSTFTEVSREYTTGPALGFYGMLTVDKTSLKLQAYELHADGSDPEFDTLEIKK